MMKFFRRAGFNTKKTNPAQSVASRAQLEDQLAHENRIAVVSEIVNSIDIRIKFDGEEHNAKLEQSDRIGLLNRGDQVTVLQKRGVGAHYHYIVRFSGSEKPSIAKIQDMKQRTPHLPKQGT